MSDSKFTLIGFIKAITGLVVAIGGLAALVTALHHAGVIGNGPPPFSIKRMY